MKTSSKFLFGMATLGLFLSGCNSVETLVPVNGNDGNNEYRVAQRCAALNNKLTKVNEYIERVTNTDAFHLEEEAVALQNPNISVSTNKKQMLKDAQETKKALELEGAQLNCAKNK